MKIEFYSENTHRLLFTVFDSSKQKKTNMFRVHHHTELELGYITGGSGIYVLNDQTYETSAGDVFLVRPGEQHCVPTIYSDELTSFNIYLTSYYLWNICSEYIEPSKLMTIVGQAEPILHRFRDFPELSQIQNLFYQSDDADGGLRNRYEIRRYVLNFVCHIASRLTLPSDTTVKTPLHLADIQNTIVYLHDHLTEQMSLDDIAKISGLSKSHLSSLFKVVTGITPYEYLLLKRIEKSVALLRETDESILAVSQECGFQNLANFNKSFKKITGMTPSDYRITKKKESDFKSDRML